MKNSFARPQIAALGFTAGTTSFTAITPSASANTKGSWVQISASLPFDVERLRLHGNWPDTLPNGGWNLIDIGVGAAASERALVANIFNDGTHALDFELPVRIPKGTRLSARSQIELASQGGIQLAVYAISKGRDIPDGYDRTQTIGADTAASKGLALTDPGATNTKGAWTQLVASTTFDAKEVMLCIEGENIGVAADKKISVDVGVGAAASEKVILPDIFSWVENNDHAGKSFYSRWPVNIPAGSRVAARFQSNAGSAGDRATNMTAILFG